MRPDRLAVLILLPIVAFAGCLEPSDRVPDGTSVSPGGEGNETLEMETLARGQYSDIQGPVRRVIETPEAWAELWAEHTSSQTPTPERPMVDFATQQVLAVVLEEKGNTCWHVEITDVTRSAEGVRAAVATITPSPGAACGQAMTRPFHFVAIAAGEGPVSFTEQTKTWSPASDEPPAGAEGGSADEASIRDLAHGQHSGAQGPVRRVIAEQAEWETFWNQHGSRQMPAPERPEVDFSTERVLAVVLEEKPNGCWATRVTNATGSGGELVVEVTTYAPPPDTFCTDVITNPFHFVALAGWDGAVRFEERQASEPPSEGEPSPVIMTDNARIRTPVDAAAPQISLRSPPVGEIII